MMRVVAIGLMVVVLAGCATSRSGTEVREAELAKIVKGKTTKGELVRLLGPPTSASTKGDGTELLIYRHSVQKISNPLLVVPIVGAFSSFKRETQARAVIFTVRNGVVEEIETSTESGTGCLGPLC